MTDQKDSSRKYFEVLYYGFSSITKHEWPCNVSFHAIMEEWWQYGGELPIISFLF